MTDPDAAAGAALVLLALIAVELLFLAAWYVWTGLSFSRLFRRMSAEPWRGWVPVLNTAEVLALGGVSRWWVLLFAVPIANLYALFLYIVAANRVGRLFGKGAGMTVLAVLVPPLWATLLGWGKVAPDLEHGRLPAAPAPARVSAATGPLATVQPGPVPAPPLGSPATPGAWPIDAQAPYDAPTAQAPYGAPTAQAPYGAPTAQAPYGAPGPAPFATPAVPSAAVDATLQQAPVAPGPPPESVANPAAPNPWAPVDAPYVAPTAPVAPAASFTPAEAAPAPAPFTPVEPATRAPAPAPTPDPTLQPVEAPSRAEPSHGMIVPPAGILGAGDAGSAHPPAAAPSQPAWPAQQPADSSRAQAAAWSAPSVPVAPVAPPGALDEADGATVLRFDDAAIDAARQPGPAAAEPEPYVDDDYEATVVVDRRPRVAWRLRLDDGSELALSGDRVLLGRNPGEAAAGEQRLAVPDSTRTLSKTHARLELVSGQWVITDLGSTNGVLIEVAGDEQLIDAGVATPVPDRFVLGKLGMRIVMEAP
ncbi:FHA domain-containing protein [Agromyces intestinalis]|uniref:FHA domain-containing protein n=1 Tax=Agromyces intestinalis TaxID=2592652 RepID=A0A5C1YEU0_9MICO|nr:DUF5684 domain-containing protein [Agromyces intestinalis]QEO13995.1 FHA domain-containing protein [Agromyces intestinalis]